MKYKLIAFDLDGTLLRDDKTISAEDIRALWHLHEAGAELVPASGRIYRGLPKELTDLPFLRWCIMANGAAVYDALEKKTVLRSEVEPDYAASVFSFLDNYPVIYDCYIRDYGYITRSMYDRADSFITDPGIMRLMRTLRKPIPDLKEFLRTGNIPLQKLQAYVQDKTLKAELMQTLSEKFTELAVTSSVSFNIEMNAANATKGHALMSLAEILSLPMAATAAFGDGSNDLTMITAAGLGVAMKNAESSVADAADYVTLSNNESGFAHAAELMLTDKI